jgi:hypothetical protein
LGRLAYQCISSNDADSSDTLSLQSQRRSSYQRSKLQRPTQPFSFVDVGVVSRPALRNDQGRSGVSSGINSIAECDLLALT